MNHHTKNTLTVLVSSILLGAAGLWLIPNRAKGAIVGAATGAAAAAGHVQQDRRLRQLAANQQTAERERQFERTKSAHLVGQASRTIEGIARTTQAHEVKIDQIEENLRSLSGQPSSNREDVSSIEARLAELESEIRRQFTSL
ncbi:hypothetical protein IQ241_08455 [Romeria aff. gracilis LEGE 07310]|uniref:Uncharacterized protein n=1 Tax=Vasconcelosia minhoensis LEGE 07310 TaxID=915328 RepID=A0A8J7ALR5_9CYAN|nr:hypothetical protein [Romeria gracilis]MBE9077325.1 hypothetical protein [Romeria aff. gracilis LEGE 07310]